MRTTDLTPEKVIKALPHILKEHPEIKVELYQILSKEYVTRGELKEYMERSDKRFEEMNRRFNEMIREMRAFREDTNRRFEDLQHWVGIVVGGFQRRAGKGLEEAIAEL